MKVQIHTQLESGDDLAEFIDEHDLESVEMLVDYDSEALIFTIK